LETTRDGAQSGLDIDKKESEKKRAITPSNQIRISPKSLTFTRRSIGTKVLARGNSSAFRVDGAPTRLAISAYF